MDKNAPSDKSTSLHLGKFAPGSTRDETTVESPTIAVKLAAKEAVNQGKDVAMPKNSGELPPEAMLGAVSYCYAKGVYSSEEIEDRMLRDPKFREAMHGEVPRAEAIRRFRVLNGDAIRATLEKAFRFMRKRPRKNPSPSAPPSQPADRTPTDATIVVVRREANERLQEAVFVDNMSKE